MTDIPDKWPVAAVLVWIATRDRAAFRIPAGKAQPNAPASCIFDRWTAANTGSSGTRPRPFWETALLDPTRQAKLYILVFRHGTVRNLRPPEEVAQAKEKLLARLNDGCLSAWQGERELTELKQDFTSAIFARCSDIRFETYFNGADVERVWPAGNKPGLASEPPPAPDEAASTASKPRGKPGPKSQKALQCVAAFEKRLNNGEDLASTLKEEANIVSKGICSLKTAEAAIRVRYNAETLKLKTKN